MDSQFAIQGKNFVLIAADASCIHSVLKFKEDEDKILQIDDNKLLCLGGPIGDRVQFGEYIKGNLHLYKYKNQHKLGIEESADYIRSELAQALRKAPYQVSALLAGYDEQGPQLFWLDYLGTKIKCDRTAHGYSAYFLLGLLDNVYKTNISYEEGLQIIRHCIKELQTRFMISQNNFVIKCVSQNGIKIVV